MRSMDAVTTIARYKLINNTGIYSQDVYSDISLEVDPCITVSTSETTQQFTPFPLFIDETMPFTSRISFYINETNTGEEVSDPVIPNR